ncbi:MAG: hypothetical protein ACXVIY_00920 [Mucilaginibacter sp.]
MSLLSPVLSVWNWFKKKFIDHAQSADTVAVTITNMAKTLLNNPVTGFLANIADAVFHTQLPTEVIAVVNGAIPKVLAIELSIEGLPANPTDADILAFEQRILNAFDVKADNSELYTKLGAQVFSIITTMVTNKAVSFADCVTAVETAYEDYLADKAQLAA